MGKPENKFPTVLEVSGTKWLAPDIRHFVPDTNINTIEQI
jgi:hypothetical protein